jgi:CBS domain-containing protein
MAEQQEQERHRLNADMSRKARDVMTPNPETVTEKDTVQKAAKIMKRADTGIVPVVDENRRLKGLITDRDIAVRVVAEGKSPATTTVHETMTKSVRTVREDRPLAEVLDTMSAAKVRRVPVVDQHNELVGIVSLADVATETNARGNVGETVKEISEARPNN